MANRLCGLKGARRGRFLCVVCVLKPGEDRPVASYVGFNLVMKNCKFSLHSPRCGDNDPCGNNRLPSGIVVICGHT